MKLSAGPAVMDFQYYLKQERNNCGGSINRKIFTLRSYGNFLKLQDDTLSPFLGIRDYAVFALMYEEVLRVGEVFALNLDSIDCDHKTITVIGKGKKRRVLPLTCEMVQILSEWIAARPHFYKSDNSDALFLSKKGNRLAIRTMEDNFKKLVTQAGFKTHFNITCHTLRHSFASHLNDEEVDILVIQSLMGHSSPRSTQPYIHPSLKRVREAMEKLPGVIFMNKLIAQGGFKFQSHHCCKRQ